MFPRKNNSTSPLFISFHCTFSFPLLLVPLLFRADKKIKGEVNLLDRPIVVSMTLETFQQQPPFPLPTISRTVINAFPPPVFVI